MITNIKRFLLVSSSSMMLLFAAVAAVPVTVHAADCGSNIGDSISAGLNATKEGGGLGCDPQGNENRLGAIAKNVVNIFSYVVGFISVIMIIYGGFRYITSGGSSEGVGAAKSTLIYAIIGLIVVALAQIIVQFVLAQSSGLTES